MGIEAVYCFVDDLVAKKEAQTKPKQTRKRKAKTPTSAEAAYTFPANDTVELDGLEPTNSDIKDAAKE